MRDRSFRQGGTSWLDDLIFRFRARSVLAKLPKPAPLVADLGCGYDARFLRLARRSGRIGGGIAVDVSLDRTRDEPSIALVEADLSHELAIDDASVSAATSLAVLEHLENPATHVTEMHRILQPGGLAIMTTPSTRSKPVLEFLAYRLHIIDEAEIRDHKHYYTEPELRRLLESAGFDASAIAYRSFAFGMNQLIVAKKAAP